MIKLKIPPIKLIGLKLGKKTVNKDGQSSIDCGNLWQQFEKEHIAGQIPNKLSDEVYAVYYDYEGDYTEPFSYFIGCKVDAKSDPPKGLASLMIPEQNYVKVIASGKMPDCISKGWEQIWHSDIERSYKYDFEVYDRRSKKWSSAEVDIFVSSK